MSLFLILLAAGDSKRLKSNIPKPFQKLNNKTLIEHAIYSFDKFRQIKKIIVVYNNKHKSYLNKIKFKNVIKIVGGKTRQESTFKGLKKIKKMNCNKILIHDVARPMPPKALIKNLLYKIKKNHAVIPVVKVNDATKRTKRNVVFKNIERSTLKFAQTPQAFTYKKLYEKHKKNLKNSFDDDSAMFLDEKDLVKTIKGSKKNFKITDEEDLEILKSLTKERSFFGIGFDVHKLIKGKKLYLGGVKINSHLGTLGHSDGDPVIHAVIDSILGACRMGDIGEKFSDRNKRFKNIRSTVLLKEIIKKIEKENYLINNIDINIIIQTPKIQKYKKKIKIQLSKICKISPNLINIKGKTTEKLGVVGKEKAVASEVITSVLRNDL